MPDTRERQVRRLFDEIVEIDVDERDHVLRQRCDDERIRREVAALLEHEPSVTTGFLGGVAEPALERPGDTIGRYTLLERIGTGGFGTVYRARQNEPIRREVALKIIKPGMDTGQVVARFEAERQALARMDHPHVATVHDAGATDRGRPYFVMELVPGEPITTYCDRRRLTIRQRLELVMQACDAIRHAHQKGVIHRDLKPTNVLVAELGSDPIVKVIDFGVAKAIDHRLTERTMVTERGQLIGTPEYMSPEQAEMGALDVDTRTDVYALGVILYELLAGVLPFDSRQLREAPLGEVQRIIREEEPPRPSTRLSSLGERAPDVAAHHGSDPRSMLREIRGDLDWIVMKALEKDRCLRYDSPAALADDLRRHLEHEPIVAGPPSAIYRARKFVRRHRIGVALTGVVAAATLLGFVGVSWGLIRVEREAEKYEHIAGFTGDMLSSIAPEVAGDLDTTLVRMMLDDASDRIVSEPVAPEVEAALRHTIGQAYNMIGEYGLAEEHLRRSLEIRRGDLGVLHPETLEVTGELGVTLKRAGMLDEADAHCRTALTGWREVRGDRDPETLAAAARLGQVLVERGGYDEADAILTEALAHTGDLGDDDPTTVTLKSGLAQLRVAQSRLPEAEPLIAEVLAAHRRTLGDDHPSTGISTNEMGVVLMRLGRFREAEEHFRDALALSRRYRGDRHRSTLTALNNVGWSLMSQGRLEEAEPILTEALETCRDLFGNDHQDTLRQLNNLTNLLSRQDRPAKAEPYAREMVDRSVNLHGDLHPTTIVLKSTLGVVLQEQGKLDEARPYYEAALADSLRVLGSDHQITLLAVNNMGFLLQATGDLEGAEPYFVDGLEATRRVMGDGHPDTLNSIHNLAALYEMQERLAEAEPLFLEAAEGYENAFGEEHPETQDAFRRLVELYETWNRPEDAAAWRVRLAAPAVDEEKGGAG